MPPHSVFQARQDGVIGLDRCRGRPHGSYAPGFVAVFGSGFEFGPGSDPDFANVCEPGF